MPRDAFADTVPGEEAGGVWVCGLVEVVSVLGVCRSAKALLYKSLRPQPNVKLIMKTPNSPSMFVGMLKVGNARTATTKLVIIVKAAVAVYVWSQVAPVCSFLIAGSNVLSSTPKKMLAKDSIN